MVEDGNRPAFKAGDRVAVTWQGHAMDGKAGLVERVVNGRDLYVRIDGVLWHFAPHDLVALEDDNAPERAP